MEFSDPSEDKSQEFQKKIEAIGVAERNSVACQCRMRTELPDGREAYLLYVRKRGLGKSNTVTYAHLGGAAKFNDADTAINLVNSLPRGSFDNEDSTDLESSVWYVNGYEMQDVKAGVVDARLKGFDDVEAQAKYESEIEDVISYEQTIKDEAAEEFIEEISEVAMKASVLFDETSQPHSWYEKPAALVDEIQKAAPYDRKSIFTPRNRVSNRNNQQEITHTLVVSGEIQISQGTAAKLIESGHINILDENTRKIDAPFVAVPVDYLSSIENIAENSLVEESGLEDVPIGVAFGNWGEVAVSSQLVDK